jgi:hypothetical protein
VTENLVICDAPFIVTTPRFLERGVRDGQKKTRKNIPKGVRFDVMNRDGFRCRYCGRDQASGARLHVDHVKPVAAGGGNEIENLVTACADCNIGKSAKALACAVPMQSAKPVETFGLSFLPDGGCHWQFVIDELTDNGATLTTFSWVDGTDYSVQHVTRDFLRERCILFANHAVFLEQANYWGDAFAGRVNARFIKERAQ